MRHFLFVLISALAILPLAARAETSIVFTPVMTSTAAPSRRALIVIPAFSGGGMTPRGALAGSDALAYRDTLRLLGFSGMVVSAITRPALRDAIRGFADSVPHDAEVAVFVLGAVIPAGGKLYVPPSDVLPSDRTPERIPTAGLDLAAILNVIGSRGPKEVVAIVDECGGGEAKPACEIGPHTIPDGVSAIVARRVPTPSGGDPVAGIATVRQELLPLMREPGLDVLGLYGRLKTKLAGTNDGVIATAALSRSFAFMPAEFLAGLPIECNRVDPATPADTLRRYGSMATLVSSCERAAATYDFSPSSERSSRSRESSSPSRRQWPGVVEAPRPPTLILTRAATIALLSMNTAARANAQRSPPHQSRSRNRPRAPRRMHRINPRMTPGKRSPNRSTSSTTSQEASSICGMVQEFTSEC